MRLCRIQQGESVQGAFYFDDHVIPFAAASAAFAEQVGRSADLPQSADLLVTLPGGSQREAAQMVADWLPTLDESGRAELSLTVDSVQLLVPIPAPKKIFLLAGNYAKHIEEGGGVAAERAETFPYVFMKPPTTTLTNPGEAFRIPQISPHAIDWELELGVVIGRGGRGIKEADALGHVAGYTVINDISDRRFRPNPERKEREKDGFFDWLHGKWHDGSCPCGPCIADAHSVPDPQALAMRLKVDGVLHQDASTAQMIFPVAAVIEFISSFVTLEAGDMISTGTSAGVGNTTDTFLQAGEKIEATIESIGSLVTPVVAE